jgi:hypothetical protein|uniref:Uncharacterized protein n=1 Tax=viral metagenome TaxID=1070528 RepID=A0A6C0IML0_9ZZZZ
MNLQFTRTPINGPRPTKKNTITIQNNQPIDQTERYYNTTSLQINMLDRLKNTKPCNCGK